MLIFWAVDDISYKLFVCLISGQSACLIIVLTTIFSLRYGLDDYAMLICACGPDFKGHAQLFSLKQRKAAQLRACLHNSVRLLF